MKKLSLTVAAGLLALHALGALAADSMSFGSIVENLDVSKNTKLHAREYWKSIVNQSVSWSGEVYNVKASGSRVQLLVADRSQPLYKGYNIVVNTRDVANAANLRIGQRVRFTGNLHGFKAERSGAVIELADAQLEGGASVASREVVPAAPEPRKASRASRRKQAEATPDAPGASPSEATGNAPAPSGGGLPTGE
ncbi:MAG TPA: hypothetical protein VMI92_10075 [Steroidobacteraceae bacterium]|nr:hypothetical protein [Steroidobacteraceae bacterium]